MVMGALQLWRLRRVLLLSVPYLLLFGWLFAESDLRDLRPAEIFAYRESPLWQAPDRDHWFGTAVNGADLFELTRLAMASSVAVAVVAVALGIAVALLVVSFFLFDRKESRFDGIERLGRVGRNLPAMVVLAIVTGGGGGDLVLVIGALAAVVALHLCPVLTRWFREGEAGFDLVAARIAGLSRREIILSRVLPAVIRRLPAVFASVVPWVVLTEMALAFLGFTGGRLSVGRMIAEGRPYLMEAPWMVTHPGLLAFAVVLALSLLGWRVSSALGSRLLPRFL